MNKPLRKKSLWLSLLALYLSLVAFVFSQVLSLSNADLQNFTADLSDSIKDGSLWLKETEESTDFAKVLLPLGPVEGQLPGHNRIWEELLSADSVDAKQISTNDFEGLIAAAKITDFSRDTVAELFFSGTPLRLFQRGNSLLLLKNNGKVQIIDIQKPNRPELSGVLPYHRVKQMDMRGDIAYLLIGDPALQSVTTLVITDMKTPDEPVEMSQFSLPDGARSFFFSGSQLVVYCSTWGIKERHSIFLYDLTDDFQLVPSGGSDSPQMGHLVRFGDYLVTTGHRSGLDIIDFSSPLQPDLVASVLSSDRIKLLTRRGDTVFAFSELNRLYVMNFQNPLHPVLSSVVEEANYLAYFVTIGGLSYFFTENGFLQVFDTTALASSVDTAVSGELLAAQTGAGFALIGDANGQRQTTVSEVLTLPANTTVKDKLFWQEFLVVLDNDDVVQFFRKGEDGRLELKRKLKLSSGQRWLAASKKQLYVGGGATIDVIGQNGLGQFVLSGKIDSPGKQSWDGLVVQRSLCVAAGTDGVFCSPAEQPDHLNASTAWVLPRHLDSLIDVRQLANPGDNRVMAVAGHAGLLSGLVDTDGQLHLDGLIEFQSPIGAFAVVGDFCLVSTGDSVEVVDISEPDSLQNLGHINLPGVERFAVASSELWAGYVPDIGWQIIPAPHLLLPEEHEFLRTNVSASDVLKSSDRYRLALFNDHQVISIPGVVTFSARESGVADVIQ